MGFFGDWDGVGLTAAIIYGVDQGDVEFRGVLREVVRTGHAYGKFSGRAGVRALMCLPAAPAPTTRTRFFFSAMVGEMLSSMNGCDSEV